MHSLWGNKAYEKYQRLFKRLCSVSNDKKRENSIQNELIIADTLSANHNTELITLQNQCVNLKTFRHNIENYIYK